MSIPCPIPCLDTERTGRLAITARGYLTADILDVNFSTLRSPFDAAPNRAPPDLFLKYDQEAF